MAIQKGVKLVIDSDAHHPVHFGFLKFGIGQARRGWAEKFNILNTMSVDEFAEVPKVMSPSVSAKKMRIEAIDDIV